VPGEKELRRVAADLARPNGIIGTADGSLLYVADIGAGKTWRYRVMPADVKNQIAMVAGMT
jgi:gluconolactonase